MRVHFVFEKQDFTVTFLEFLVKDSGFFFNVNGNKAFITQVIINKKKKINKQINK